MVKHRVYIAGPYSAPTKQGRERNTAAAKRVSIQVALKGHHVHCPHAATDHLDGLFDHAWFMELDLGIIREWATALYYIAPSKGADMELELAEELGLPVFRSLDEVPVVRKVAVGRDP